MHYPGFNVDTGDTTMSDDLKTIGVIGLGGMGGNLARQALDKGYGVAGYTPPQGFDWSGIRDSSPEAIRAIYEGLIGGIGPVVKDGVVVYGGTA